MVELVDINQFDISTISHSEPFTTGDAGPADTNNLRSWLWNGGTWSMVY